MLVTKLKNSRKFAVVLMFVVVITGALIMVGSYPMFARNISEEITDEVRQQGIADLSDELKNGIFFLYNQAYEQMDQSEMIDYSGMDRFMLLRKYIDYEIFDFKGKALLGKNNSSKVEKLIKEETDYAFRIAIVVSEDGEIQEVQVDGSAVGETTAYQLERDIFSGGWRVVWNILMVLFRKK